MSEPRVDCSQAEVKNRRTTVSISGDAPRGWSGTFELPGSEEKLRPFLESVVQQANATHDVREDEPQDEADGGRDATGARPGATPRTPR